MSVSPNGMVAVLKTVSLTLTGSIPVTDYSLVVIVQHNSLLSYRNRCDPCREYAFDTLEC